jgi:hypothetical protein
MTTRKGREPIYRTCRECCFLLLSVRGTITCPRLAGWANCCRELGRVEVLCGVQQRQGPAVTYDGRLYTEQFLLSVCQDGRWPPWDQMAERLENSRLVAAVRRLAWENTQTQRGCSSNIEKIKRWCLLPGRLLSLLARCCRYWWLAEAVCIRVRGILRPPQWVICHGWETLPAGLWLRRHYHTRIIYDVARPWFLGDMRSTPEEIWGCQFLERWLARRSDALVLPTPSLIAKFHWKDHQPLVVTIPDEVLRGQTSCLPHALMRNLGVAGRLPQKEAA